MPAPRIVSSTKRRHMRGGLVVEVAGVDHEVGAVIARGGDDVARARILAAGLALEVEARGSSDVVARGLTVAVEVGPVPAGVVVADARVRDERHADRGDDGEAREEKKRGRDERAAAPVAASGEGQT